MELSSTKTDESGTVRSLDWKNPSQRLSVHSLSNSIYLNVKYLHKKTLELFILIR
ncbi:hypothetical protein MADA3029_940227 [Vibrio nigripulchritudo MADA3029]|nr:hypothetical protein VIBNIMADA3021_1230224 [Vibrio nigripulchritudo MADA3021]CCN62333.1 hypothetical protein MADA3029_940227 [Vibrio nigripulchritudo MADA3029]